MQELRSKYRETHDASDATLSNLNGLHEALSRLAWQTDEFSTSDPHCSALHSLINVLGSELTALEARRNDEWDVVMKSESPEAKQ